MVIPLILNAKQVIGNKQSTIYQKPFWDNKYYKFDHSNFPKVSVKSHKQKIDHRLYMNGIVTVNVPARFIWKISKDLETFKGISEHIISVEHNHRFNFAVFKLSAYGYFTNESVKVKYVEKGGNYYVNFSVFEGFFKGANAQLKIAKKTRRNTDVSLQVTYDYKEWPMPKLFIEFGIEVVLQKIASKIKTFLQKEYQNKVSQNG